MDEYLGLDRLDGIVYINLDHRSDRKERLLREFDRLQLKRVEIVRVPGIYTPLNGRVGCFLGHIRALEIAQERGWNKTLILEDDAQFSTDLQNIDHYLNAFFNQFKDDWDVFLLGGKYLQIRTLSRSFFQVFESRRAHAYLLNGSYLPTLKECYCKGYKRIEKDIFITDSVGKSIDVIWSEEQQKGRWIAPLESLVKQAEGFSDIVCDFRDYREVNFS
jgi:glycosyl transferase family 25